MTCCLTYKMKCAIMKQAPVSGLPARYGGDMLLNVIYDI